MIVQLALVVFGLACTTVLFMGGHPEAAGMVGGTVAALFIISMM